MVGGGFGLLVFVDWFASYGVVEFELAVWAGGASLMVRPLASEARGRQSRPTSTKWTIDKGL